MGRTNEEVVVQMVAPRWAACASFHNVGFDEITAIYFRHVPGHPGPSGTIQITQSQ